MAVKMRLTRMGRKKRPFYRIVVLDSRKARDGRYIENVGTYSPISDPPEITVKADRVNYWLDQGAALSDTVRNILKAQGIMHERALRKRGLSDKEVEDEMKRWEVLQIEKKRRQDKKKEETKKEEKAAAAAPPEEEKAEVDTPAEEPKAEEAPAVEKPAEEPKAEEAPAEEAPAEEPKAEEAPAEEAPAEEPKAEEAPAEEPQEEKKDGEEQPA